MPSPEDVKAIVTDVVGTSGDPTVLEYVIACLEAGDFEYGPGGSLCYDAFGEMLVRKGFATRRCRLLLYTIVHGKAPEQSLLLRLELGV